MLTASAGLALAGISGRAAEAVESTSIKAAVSEGAASLGTANLWGQFCDAIRPLAQRVSPSLSPDDPTTQVEGIRCLSRLVSLGLDRFVEHGDPRYPSFYELQTATRKYLGDNPDQTYRAAPLEGRGTYRVRGSVAGAAGVEIGVYAGTFESGGSANGGRRLVRSRDERTLQISDHGTYELTLGPGAGSGNHLQTDPDANALLIRTYFWDRALRVAHPMPTIERLDVTSPPLPLDLSTLARGMLATAAFVDGSLAFWNAFEGIRTAPNTLIQMPDDGTVQTPSRVRYLNGVIELEPTQAFVLDLMPKKEPSYWSVVLQNMWGETPDWRYHNIVLNNRELVRKADGSVRIVVSDRNPKTESLPNCMDRTGHRRLLLSLRWRGEEELPKWASRVVSISSLEG